MIIQIKYIFMFFIYVLPVYRYRIVLLAEDSTEAFNFVLYDRASKRLVGKTITKLIAEGYKVWYRFQIFGALCCTNNIIY